MVLVQPEPNPTLQAEVSGGLNTISSPLTMPPEDSPTLMNVDVNIDGTVSKRRGTQYAPANLQDTSVGYRRFLKAFPVTLQTGKVVLVSKWDSRLYIQPRISATQYGQFDLGSCWSASAVNTVPDGVVSYEPRWTRVIMTTGINVPIQATLVEAAIPMTLGAPGAAFSGTVNGKLWNFATTANTFAWVKDTVTGTMTYDTLAGISCLGNITSGTLSTVVPAGSYIVYLCWVSWQWWTEAVKLDGDQVIQSVTQGTTEKFKAIPSRLLSDIAITSSTNIYPMRVCSSANYDAVYAINVAQTPVGVNDYCFSSGAEMGANPHVPSPYFVSFGALPGANRAVVFHRGYDCGFNGGSGIAAQDMYVEMVNDQTAWIRNTANPPSEGGAGAGSAKWGFNPRGAFYTVVAGASVAKYVSFDGTAAASGGNQLPQDDQFLVWNGAVTTLKNNGYVGSGAQVANDIFYLTTTGQFPVFGLQQYCDFANGSFPTTVCIVQGRLALGGFPLAPNSIAFSEVQDTTIPGRFYENFQTTLERGLATDGFDVVLSGYKDDTITALREFQGTLFAWTRYKLYRIYGGGGGAIAGTNAIVATVAETGAVSAQAVAPAVDNIFFLGQGGVYSLLPTQNADSYTVQEKSVKIRNLFSVKRSNLSTAWMVFDGFEGRLYVGLPDNVNVSVIHCSQLFVYHSLRDAWTQYSDLSGLYWFSNTAFVVYNSPTDVQVYVTYSATSTLRTRTLELKWEYYLDEATTGTTYPTTPTFSTYLSKTLSFTTAANRYIYETADRTGITDSSAFGLAPTDSIVDVNVYYNGVPLTYGTHWVKTPNAEVLLLFNPTAGQTLQVELQQNWGGVNYNPVGAIQNGQIVPPNLLNISPAPGATSPYAITSSQFVNGDLLRFGTVYPCWYTTPVITLGSLNWKRVTHILGYYQHTEAVLGTKWKASEVGTQYDILYQYKTRVNFNLVVLFSDTKSGDVLSECYGSSLFLWDDADFNTSSQYKPAERIVLPVVGGGYDIQIMHHTFSLNTFQLSGYELHAILKKGKGTGIYS